MPHDFRYGEYCRTPRDRGRVVELPDVPTVTRAEEAYTSVFRFGPDFAEYVESTGSVSGFAGVCRAVGVHADFDSPHDDLSLREARTFMERALAPATGVLVDDCRAWFSGNKGVHVLISSAEIAVLQPSPKLPGTVKKIAAALARGLSTWDCSVYDLTRLFRAPNSRHPKTGLFKIELNACDLFGAWAMTWEQIRERAKKPRTQQQAAREYIERAGI
jgi:hypothetical protein